MDEKRIGEEQLTKAMGILNKYKSGKASLEARIVENDEFWKLRHFKEGGNPNDPRYTSGWLVNAILNRHADAMDNYPEPNCLPRASDDVEEAKRLSQVLPVIMEQNDFINAWSKVWWDKLKKGTGVYGVFWDSNKQNGLGDISIRRIDLLNLFWEPGILDIQDSANIFVTESVNNEEIVANYPELEGKLYSAKVTTKYKTDDQDNDSDKSEVVDWYYKKNVGGKTVLHYCKFVGNTVLYATENDEQWAERGWYDHGKYPFVVDTLYPQEGTICGYGFIDIGKDAQLQIDLLNQAAIKNALSSMTPRFFIRGDGGVNEKEFADFTKPFVHTTGNLGEDSIRPIDTKPLSGNNLAIIQQKISELRETSGNTESATGVASSSVTAASAIAALQEASGKLSRDAITFGYNAYKEVCLICIELIRQFYGLPRQFRITGEGGEVDFVSYDNTNLQPVEEVSYDGVEAFYRTPILDIEVVPQNESKYTKMEYNQLALNLFSAGAFNPQMTDQTLAMLSLMDFKGKDALQQRIAENGTLAEALKEAQQRAAEYAAILQGMTGDPRFLQNEAQAAAMTAMPQAKQAPDIQAEQGGENAVTAKAREQALNAANPVRE